MARIKDIIAREILDSRGNPTVSVDLILDNDIVVTSSVPSGASTGSREALELRDGDNTRFHGKGVLNAVKNVNEVIKPVLVGMELNQLEIDKMLISLDGTPNKSKLGANAILAVSLSVTKALAKCENKELYEYLSNGRVTLPIPFINIINGGVHATNNLDIQEFMIVPVMKGCSEKIRCASEVFFTLKKILTEQNLSTSVGDEGGFAPNLSYNSLALDFIVKAIKESNYIPGKDVYIALDIAASEIYNKETNTYQIDGKYLSVEDLTKYYLALTKKYPIISIEDPYYEQDYESLTKLTELIGDKVMLVGDDYFVTNTNYLNIGIQNKSGNAILLKANQVGTISEMLDTIKLANQNGYKTIISHRSGETMDTFIADFAVGLNIPFIKSGSMSRGERICKYNRLMRIEENLKN
jgi:enolase